MPATGLFKSKTMTKQQKRAFLSQSADGNIMRLAQALLSGPVGNRWQITHAMRLLSKHSYVKDLTMTEVIEAVNMISDKEI